jgi:transglutaminase-like putative cysteine protease
MLWHARILVRPELAARELIGWAALALLPALIAALWTRRPWWGFPLLVLPVLLIAIGNQTGHWPFRPHLLGYTGYFAKVWSDLSDGGRAWVSVTLPFDPQVDPELRMAVTCALLVLMVLVAAAILVWRAPLLAVLGTFVPFAVTSTVFRVGDDLLRSVIMLGIVLLLIGAVDRRRLRSRPGLAMGIGASVIVVALAVAAVPGVAKGAYLPWRTWAQAPGSGVSVKSYVWDHTYGPLIWPEDTTEVLRIRSPYETYWRAIVLEDFDGIAWRANPTEVGTSSDGTVQIPEDELSDAVRDAPASDRYDVRVTNVGLADVQLVTPSQTTQVAGISRRAGLVRYSDTGVLESEKPIPLRSSYVADAVNLDPTPEELNGTSADYPEAVVERDLQVRNGIQFPAWGSENRDAEVRQILAREFFDPRLTDWSKVYDQALEITKEATTPYEAVVALETYFQTNFKYDETADYSTAPNGPLPAFFLGEGKNGYCQMFSGSMATILRMLGIPARVAEGFTPGKLDPRSRRFVVTDRDAHAWVEVYFPGFGWLPFEPTPTRALDARFSGTSSGFDAAAQAAAAGSALLADILRDRGTLGLDAGGGGGRVPFDERGGLPTGVGPAGAPGGLIAPPSDGGGWRPGTVSYLILGAVVLLVLFLLVKRFRALLAYLLRDPHRIAAAVRGDLQAWVVDQGITDGGRALTPNEFGEMLKREFAVDATTWARYHTRARYGPEDGSYDAAIAARTEARMVKKRIRASLTATERVRGAIDVRSLIP